MPASRIANAKRNMIWSFVNKMAVLLLTFITRTVFIYALGKEYLGLNGLFSSVLNLLALAELGVGSAMVFSLYEPMAKKDSTTICALLNLYRKLYLIIGLIILVGGLIAIPFIHLLVKGDVPSYANIYVVFLIFLANTALSYFLYAYRQSLFIADQRMDVTNNISTVITIISNVAQIGVLLIFHSYYAYIILLPAFVIINNLIIKYESNKKYPEYVCKGKLSKDILSGIKKRITGLFLYRICNVFRDSVDNIFISAFISLATVGIYSNYYLLMSTVQSFFNTLRQSVTATIGNSVVQESQDKNYKDFFTIQWLYMWPAIWAATCLFCLIQPFVLIWVGESYLLSTTTVFLISMIFLCNMLGDICATYRNAIGLWWQDKHRPVIEAIVKVLLSVILVQQFGINGILVATICCLLLINSIWASYILYKHYFTNYKQSYYIMRNILYLSIAITLMFSTNYVCNLVDNTPVVNLVIRILICLVFPNIFLFSIFRILPEYHDGMLIAKRMLKRQ